MNHLDVANGELISNRKSSEIIEENVVDISTGISCNWQLDESKDLIECSSVTNIQCSAKTYQQPMMDIPAVIDIDDIHLDNLAVSSPVKSCNLLASDDIKATDSWSSSPSSLICHTDIQSIDLEVNICLNIGI